MPSKALAIIALSLVATLPAAATTFVMVPDGTLADQADVVVEAHVLAVEHSPAAGMPSTDYMIQVDRALAGAAPGSALVVRVPGGVGPDGIGRKIWGAPEFVPGERALLFLAARGDGTYRILHLALGAFRVLEAGGKTIAARDFADTHELRVVEGGGLETAETVERPRDLDQFASWIEDRKGGIRREADYFTELPAEAGELERAGEKFTLLIHPPTGLPIRWFEFDSGGSVDFRAHQGGQPSVPGGGFDEFQRALAAWNGDPATPINFVFGGATAASGGFTEADGFNAILFEDPNNDIEDAFVCGEGGILAIGGPAFIPDNRGTFNGRSYIRALEADIVTNDGISCFFSGSANPGRLAEELFTHELGHTLGLGHSCDNDVQTSTPACTSQALDDATMRWAVHNDGRGASLRGDDRAGLASVYRKGAAATKKPVAPNNLRAVPESPTEVVLTWNDRSNNEVTFHVEIKIGRNPFRDIGSVGAGTTEVLVTGLQPRTNYVFRVRAKNEKGNSPYSNQARVKTPAQ